MRVDEPPAGAGPADPLLAQLLRRLAAVETELAATRAEVTELRAGRGAASGSSALLPGAATRLQATCASPGRARRLV